MIITVSSFKGGVGKTTTAIHLAAYLQRLAPTVLADGDLNRSASSWARRGDPSFQVADEGSIGGLDFEHLVIDTPARPSDQDLIKLASSCDLLVLPTTPTTFALEAVVQTLEPLGEIPPERYRILLTMVPPHPSKEGEKARDALLGLDLSVANRWIRRYAVYQKAEKNGVTVDQVKGDRSRNIAWSDYDAVGRELLPNFWTNLDRASRLGR